MYLTAYESAGAILADHHETHIQVSDNLIVPKIFIKDVYVKHGIVELNNGFSDFFGEEYLKGILKHLSSRPKCGCKLTYKTPSKDGKNWFCNVCLSERRIADDLL